MTRNPSPVGLVEAERTGEGARPWAWVLYDDDQRVASASEPMFKTRAVALRVGMRVVAAARARPPVAQDPFARVAADLGQVGRFATQILGDLRHVVTWMVNAAEALSLLAEDSGGFDVVFSDAVMPGMNGIELGLTIRRDYPGLPVVLASGHGHVFAKEGRHDFELVPKILCHRYHLADPQSHGPPCLDPGEGEAAVPP